MSGLAWQTHWSLGSRSRKTSYKDNIEQVSNDVSMSEASFPEPSNSHSPAKGDVDHELQISAMLFSDLDFQSSLTENELEDPDLQIFNDAHNSLEEQMEDEGLRYVGGYIVRKFPQHGFLGTHVEQGDNTWIGAICRKEGSLMAPSMDFFKELKRMEALFKTYHGNDELKPEKNAIHNMVEAISKHVTLPSEVIKYFVKCRLF